MAAASFSNRLPGNGRARTIRISSFLLRERDVAVDGFRAAHDFNGAIVEFGGDARFTFVFSPRDHADSGNENHGGIGVAHGRRVGLAAALVVGLVVLSVLVESAGQRGLQRFDVSARRIPVREQGSDLGPQEVVRT